MKSYFKSSANERRGLLLLLFLLCIAIGLRTYFFSYQEGINGSEEQQKALSFELLAKNDTIDINKLTYFDLCDLGANKNLANAILKKRPFSCFNQLFTVKGYSVSKMRYFEEFFHLNIICENENTSSSVARKEIKKININTADYGDLKKLGLRSIITNRIIKFRKQLGGFYSKNQFEEIYGISKKDLQTLHSKKIFISGIKKMNINKCSAKKLASHPYIKKRQAQTIKNYKKTIQQYVSKDQLYKVYNLDSSDVEKIIPYLEF